MEPDFAAAADGVDSIAGADTGVIYVFTGVTSGTYDAATEAYASVYREDPSDGLGNGPFAFL